MEQILSPLNQKVYAVVNYDNFIIHPELIDDYSDTVTRIVNRFYLGVTRYTTSAFLRMKLGGALANRNAAPHIYESSREAQEALMKFSQK